MEKAISVVGLLTILGLAYLFSKHRQAVRPRTIFWGVGLQLLFAVIILRPGTPSFIGMAILAVLITLYALEGPLRSRFGSPLTAAAVAAVIAMAAIGSAFLLEAARLASWLVGLAVLTLVVGFIRKRADWMGYGFITFLLAGVGALWRHGVDGRQVFEFLSVKVSGFLALSDQGAYFLFDNLARADFLGGNQYWPGFGFQFAFRVLPTIIFFSAFISVLYHLGIIQVVVASMARFMRWSMGTSGAETVSCTGNVFVGQTEAPFLVKPFLPQMTASELHAIMVGGFATIAGSVLAGYIQMGVNAGHLLAASVMSAPAALVLAKLLYPETETSVTAGDVEIPEVKTADNLVGAAANGVTDGLKLALNVGAMLIAFIALIAFVDSVLGFADGLIDGRFLKGTLGEDGEYGGIFPGSLQTFFGTVLSPLAFLMGVPWQDSQVIGNLLGVKLAVNEFVAFSLLGELVQQGGVSERALTIATYALCGFANFSSIGIQIGGLGAVVPERRSDLAKVGMRAMIGGALASWTTASIAGILL